MRNTNTLIIGGGMGGLFAAYQLRNRYPDMDIIILDKGAMLKDRKCPASMGKACVHCKTCAITSGVAGSGAFSDAKFNIGTAYGGTLSEEIGDDVAMKYINKVDNILKEFSEDYPKMFESNEELKLKCVQNNLRLLDMNVRHLGTDRNAVTMQHLIDYLIANKIEIIDHADCISLYKPVDEYFVAEVVEHNHQYNFRIRFMNPRFCIARKLLKIRLVCSVSIREVLYLPKIIVALLLQMVIRLQILPRKRKTVTLLFFPASILPSRLTSPLNMQKTFRVWPI